MFKYIKNQSKAMDEQQKNVQELEAKIDYIAMMTDIDIDADEQEVIGDEQ